MNSTLAEMLPNRPRSRRAQAKVLIVAFWLSLGGMVAPAHSATDTTDECGGLLAGSYRLLASTEEVDLCQAYGQQLVLVVNTASQCGFTGQFEGLETLYQRYRARGLVVLGFPSDDFNQEHADERKTAEVCQLNYGVSFPMMATTSVKGASANALFSKLNAATEPPSWNFNKYLIDPNSQTVEHFGSRAEPVGGALEARIDQLLSPRRGS